MAPFRLYVQGRRRGGGGREEEGRERDGRKGERGKEYNSKHISRATTPSPLVPREGKYICKQRVYDGIETYFLCTQDIQYPPVKEALYIVHTDDLHKCTILTGSDTIADL